MAGNIDRRVTARGKNPVQRGGPGGKVGVLIDARITGFLDEVAAEHHGAVDARNDRDEVMIGVPATWMADRHLRTTEPDHCRGNRLRWSCERRDRTVHFVSVGTMLNSIGTQFLHTGRHRRHDLG